MPVSNKIILNDNAIVYVWDIIESSEELCCKIHDKHLFNTISAIKNKQLVNQRLAIQLILKYHFGKHVPVFKIKQKPYILSQLPISISHSYNKAALYIPNSNKPCGIDIEKITDKPFKIKNRFLNEQEIKTFKPDNDLLTLLWSCKEALFKFLPEGNIDFKKDLSIKQIDFGVNKIKAIAKGKEVDLSFKKIDDFFLVYTL